MMKARFMRASSFIHGILIRGRLKWRYPDELMSSIVQRQKIPFYFRWLGAVVLVLGMMGATAAGAYPLSAEQAREARKKGHVQSLREVVRGTAEQFPGKLLKAVLHREEQQWIYTLIILQEGGYLTKVWVDAQDGHLIRYKSRKRQRHEHRKKHEDSSR